MNSRIYEGAVYARHNVIITATSLATIFPIYYDNTIGPALAWVGISIYISVDGLTKGLFQARKCFEVTFCLYFCLVSTAVLPLLFESDNLVFWAKSGSVVLLAMILCIISFCFSERTLEKLGYKRSSGWFENTDQNK